MGLRDRKSEYDFIDEETEVRGGPMSCVMLSGL